MKAFCLASTRSGVLLTTVSMKAQWIISTCLSFGLLLGAVPGVGHALPQGCMLKMTLTVKDTQDGFAGTTGTIWTIKPDCTFQVSRIFGQHVAEPHLQGTLTPEQQTQLSKILAKAAELPPQLGQGTPVNARRITLEYDGKVSVLSMSPGDRDRSAIRAGSPHDPARRLLEVTEAVQDMLGS
jgi:hypothetical protein